MSVDDWRPFLSATAERDFDDILDWTKVNFGPLQLEAYRDVIRDAILELRGGPNAPGTIARDDISPGLKAMHVARRGRRGRHFVLFRVADQQTRTIEIVRLLHDARVLGRHVPDDETRREG